MSLQIIYGRSGSGKTYKCFDILKTADSANRYIYLVPEQFSQESERQIAAFGKSAFINVMSFGRLAHYVFSKLGPVGRKVIDSQGELMLAQKALMTVANKLSYLSVSVNNTDFTSQLLTMASEFNRHLVTPQMLEEAAENIKDEIFKMKLADIALIYKTYCDLIEKAGGSDADNLNLLKKQIESSDIFTGENIVINHFASFTPQETEVIKLLMQRCNQFTVAITADDKGSDTIDIFAESRGTINKLKTLAQESGIKVESDVYLGASKKYAPDSALAVCEANYFKYPCKAYEEYPEDVKVVCTKNIYNEVETAAITILRMCRENNMRMRDFVIAVRSEDEYHGIIKQVFDKFEIPYFINEKATALSHPLTQTALAMFASAMNNFPSDMVIRYIKSGYADITRDERYILENYVIAAGIDRNKWTNEKGFDFIPQDFEQYHQGIKESKNRVIKPIKDFADSFSGRKTAVEISKAFYKMLDSSICISAEKQLENLTQENRIDEADNLRLAWSAIVKTIERIADLIGDENLTLEKYYNIFTQGLTTCSLVTPPPFADRVLICNPDGYRSNNRPVFMLLGALDGVFPAKHRVEGILSDIERETITSMGVELAKTSQAKLMGEQYLIYSCLTAPSQMLYISYPMANDAGEACTPSPVIGRLKQLIPQLEIKGEYADTQDIESEERIFEKLITRLAKRNTDDPLWSSINQWFADNRPEKYVAAQNALSYTNLPNRLSQKSLDIIYPEMSYTSISRLEGYSRCQFAHFIQYGMRVNPRKEYELKAVDTGSLMHEVLEEFSMHMLEKEGGWKQLTESYAIAKTDEICDKVVQKFLGDISLGSKRFDYMSRRIKRLMKTVIWNIASFYKESDFEPFGYELSFGDGVLPPLEITLDNGRKVRLVGKIDRVDVLQADNGRYFSIVDYKSSAKEINYSFVKAGLQIQLPVYLDAICKAESREQEAIPAAMLYYHLADPLIKGFSNTDKEKINAEVTKALRMKGIVAADVNSEDSLKPAVVYKTAVPAAHIKKLCDFTNSKIREVLDEMLHGKINIRPYRFGDRTGCDYCPYISICKFDTECKGNRFKNVKKYTAEEFYSNVDK